MSSPAETFGKVSRRIVISRIRFFTGCTLLLLLFSFPGASQEIQTRNRYPRVGLVLSGGGARGIAHIGVLKVIEDIGIPIDYIAGTSMGSVVGGLYSVGYSVEELESIALETRWSELFSDIPPRNFLPYEQKRDLSQYLVSLGFGRTGVDVPQGLTSGRNILTLLSLLTLGASPVRDFDEFPIPYRAVVTDIENGTPVILDHGILAEAMRASIAVPGFFSPYEIDGRTFIDGGVLNNLPVDVVREMGADIVIAVDVAPQLSEEHALEDPVSVVTRTVRVFIRSMTEEQQEMADVLIVPDLEGHSTLSFSGMEELIRQGTEAADSMREELLGVKKLVSLSRQLPEKGRERESLDLRRFFIHRIRVLGNEMRSREQVLRNIPLEEMSYINITEICGNFHTSYFAGNSRDLLYTLSKEADQTILNVSVREQQEEAHSLRLGLAYESRFSGAEEGQLDLFTALQFNGLTGAGSFLRFDLDLLSRRILEISSYQPLFSGFYGMPFFRYSEDYLPVYRDDGSIDRYRLSESLAGIRSGILVESRGEAGLSLLLSSREESLLSAGSTSREDTLLEASAFFRVDTLDRFPFPDKGFYGGVNFSSFRDYPGLEDGFWKLTGLWRQYLPAGSMGVLELECDLGTSFGETLPLFSTFFLGGQDSFPSYHEKEFTGDSLARLSLLYRHFLTEFPSGSGFDVYLSGGIHGGNVWKAVREDEQALFRYSASVGLGVNTLLGGLRFSAAVSADGRTAVYFSFGYRT